MGFRDDLEADLETFFNEEEFASLHSINSVEMPIVLDNDLLKMRQRKSNDPDGIYIGDLLFHVAKSVFGDRPVPGQIIDFDGQIYRVADMQEDEMVYSITLAANES